MLRQVVSGLAGGVVKSVVGNVTGKLEGVIGRGVDGSSMGSLGGKSNYATKNLAYPIDVEEDPMQGHYILFGIREMTHPKIKRKPSKKLSQIRERIEQDTRGRPTAVGPPSVLSSTGALGLSIANSQKLTPFAQPKGLESGQAHFAYRQAVKNSKRLATSIALYMPPNVQVTYTPNYTDVNVGGMAGAIVQGVDLIESMITNKGTTSSTAGMWNEMESAFKLGMMKSLDALAPGIRALSQIKDGRIISNKMELSFEGVNRREFNYTFIFMPKSEKEAIIVDEIIWMFKYHALPEFHESVQEATHTAVAPPSQLSSNPKITGGSSNVGRSMTIPDTFDITYMYRNKDNSMLNKISTCFCTNVQVQYGGDRYTAYNEIPGKGNPPQRTTLTLSFKEMEIITKKRIDEGF